MSKYITLVEGDLVCNIPKGMTNGEVIQALFPDVKVSRLDGFFVLCQSIAFEFTPTLEWWNAPYKTESEELDNSTDTVNELESGYECFHCGHRSVYWQSDFDFEDFGYEGQGIVHICSCANCGAEIEYRVTIEDEEPDEEFDAKLNKLLSRALKVSD